MFYDRFRTTGEKAELISSHSLPLSVGPSSSATPFLRRPAQPARRWRLGDIKGSSIGVQRFRLPRGSWLLYVKDFYHTMLNMPWWRFLIVFFCIYLLSYIFFALLYLLQPTSCLDSVKAFSHALWFSVQTAATIGYGGALAPNPDCAGTNILVTIQVICAALVDYCMMGLVFARFAAPMPRAEALRFSTNVVLYRQESTGLWCLAFRMANIRKHALLQPSVELMLVIPSKGPHATLEFKPLEVESLYTQTCNLRLGMAAQIMHVIRPTSPLFELSLEDLEQRELEVLCFMTGIDPMTSNNLQAHRSYTAKDMRMNERFTTIDVQSRGGRVGMDLSTFDNTHIAALATYRGDTHEGFLMPVGEGPQSTLDGIRTHMFELRSRSFRTLSTLNPNGGQTPQTYGDPTLQASTSQAPQHPHRGSPPTLKPRWSGALGKLPVSVDASATLLGTTPTRDPLTPTSSGPGEEGSPGGSKASPSSLVSMLDEVLKAPELAPDLRKRIALARHSLSSTSGALALTESLL